MKNGRALPLAVGGIIAVVFTVAMFLLCPDKDGVFWTSYLFVLLGIAGVSFNAWAMRSDDAHFASNLVLVTISAVYLIADVVAWVLGAVTLRMKLPGYFLLHLSLCAVFLVIWLIARSVVGYINTQD